MHQKPGSKNYTEADIFPWLAGEDEELDAEEVAQRMAAMFPMVAKG